MVYLNSSIDRDETKMAILAAIPTRREVSREWIETNLPEKGNAFLAWVDNGRFAALGVLYDDAERRRCLAGLSRRHFRFYEAPIAEIIPFLARDPRDQANVVKVIRLGQ